MNTSVEAAMASSATKEDEDYEGSDSAKEEVPEEEDADEFEETAEVLMTDMSLEDDMDKLRDSEPGPQWIYHIEAYPWHADDINEHFIRLMKLASFTKLTMRKKPVSHESEDVERIDDKVMERQRKGSLHLYAESYQTAKAIMRYSTWKNMVSKELTFEITKRSMDNDSLMTARIDVDTNSMCKIRFRDKIKGSLEARSAKMVNLPSNVSRDFLDVVFARSNPAYDGPETEIRIDKNDVSLYRTLAEIPDFDGSLDAHCPNRSSCRAFVLAHKAVDVLGNKLTITANDPQTMVVPPETQIGTPVKNKEENKAKANTTGSSSLNITIGRGRGIRENPMGRVGGSLAQMGIPIAHPIQSARIHPLTAMGRMRGIGGSRGMIAAQQPASASFSRAGPGMPIPMTGRQKMNEKMRRNYPNTVAGVPNTAVHPSMATPAGYRAANMNSIGDAFKQEIASLQCELERSTQAIEAKIERLKEERRYYNDFNEEMQIYDEGEWEEGLSYDYDSRGQEDYYGDGYDYDLQPQHDALGYELAYEQPVEQQMMMVAHRGMPRRRAAGRARGFLRVPAPSLQRAPGFVDTMPIRRSSRGSRGGGGGGAIYQSPGPSGYW